MAEPPNKKEREICWNARDNYFKCLDNNNEDHEKCTALKVTFDKDCSKTWVKHFVSRRKYLKYRQKIETEGYEPLDSAKQKM